jgi:hypothetical protein
VQTEAAGEKRVESKLIILVGGTPGPSPQPFCITQELFSRERLACLKFAEAARELEDVRCEINDLWEKGAPVEPGPHKIQLVVRRGGGFFMPPWRKVGWEVR